MRASSGYNYQIPKSLVGVRRRGGGGGIQVMPGNYKVSMALYAKGG